MTRRVVVNVSTGSFTRGLARLARLLNQQGECLRSWNDLLPFGCPAHRDVPYAFKAYALKIAADEGAEVLIWSDASVIPIRKLTSVWEQIERDGYWISRNGWDNSDWTADSAYPDLFPTYHVESARQVNQKIPHVVGTAFGLDIRQPNGREFLGEYYRLASETRAFCGPWQNTNAPNVEHRNEGRITGPCGPPTTLGHRHDQSAMSVLAWRLGMRLTDGPHVFSYAKRDDAGHAILDPAAYAEDTVLVAVGV